MGMMPCVWMDALIRIDQLRGPKPIRSVDRSIDRPKSTIEASPSPAFDVMIPTSNTDTNACIKHHAPAKAAGKRGVRGGRYGRRDQGQGRETRGLRWCVRALSLLLVGQGIGTRGWLVSKLVEGAGGADDMAALPSSRPSGPAPLPPNR